MNFLKCLFVGVFCLNLVACGFTEGFEKGVDRALNSDEEEKLEFNVDFEKCIEETKTELTDPTYFDFVKDIHIGVEDERITFTAVLGDSTSDEVALDFADTMLRRFNSSAQLQDKTVKGGSKDYLGGLYDAYDVSIGVSPQSKVDDQKEWYVFDAIAKGVQRQPKLQK